MARHRLKIIVEEIEQKNYHLFIIIKIGKLTCRLLVDTGASKTVLDQSSVLKFVKKNKIKLIDTKSVGLGNMDVETHIAKLKNLKFGTKRGVALEVAVLDLSHVNNSYNMLALPQIDGVLGSDFLMKYKAVINYEKKTLSLK